ncbi:CHAD domain-containing protein [Nocardioides sp.]|uniref:CYTH and CHAD domain-containing protein n=1 Tax=Nocardioides sp. TaxID=35761 RepID=UPI003D10E81C
MVHRAPSEFVEREVTLSVPSDWVVPELDDAVPPGGSVVEARFDLEATYLDTADHLLAALGITLRRRRGGDDPGWHLKVPTAGARVEIQSLSRQLTPPRRLTDRLAGVCGGRELVEVATIGTTRRVQRLLDAAGGLVVEIADDHVLGVPLDAPPGSGATVTWREVEVELGAAGTDEQFELVVGQLVAAGAVEQGTTMKLATVIDLDLPVAGDAVSQWIRDQCRRVLLGEVRLRGETAPETVHDTRVAVRRLRSALRVFAPILREGDDVPDGDLRWFAGLFGDVRDSDVLAHQLTEGLDALPGELVLGPVRRDVCAALARQRATAVRAWLTATREDRYTQTMATITAWYLDPPVCELSDRRLHRLGTALLQDVTRTAEKRLAAADDRPDGWHRARKAAKRMRYTGEALEPLLRGASEVADRGEHLQELLGEHQDLQLHRQFLLREARRWGGRAGHQSFTLGLLYAEADRRAAALRQLDSAP